jgi:hypothetical protein
VAGLSRRSVTRNYPSLEIPDIAAKSGIIRLKIPILNGSKYANEHYSGSFWQPDKGPDLDGIAYRSRHDNGELCFALFDRVRSADFDAGRTQLFSEQPNVCDSLMARYGAVYDKSPPIPPP